MELENLKNAWEELNSRITRNELTNQRIITEMVMQRKENVTLYFTRRKNISVIITVLIWIIVPFAIYIQNIAILPSALVIMVMLAATVLTIIGNRKWGKIQQWEKNDIEELTQHVLEFKIFTKISYIVIYILILPVIIYAYYKFPHLWGVLTAVIIGGILGDYFIYHTISDRLKEFSNVVKELEELKQMQK